MLYSQQSAQIRSKNMVSTTLEYSKIVLRKVSFNPVLFKRELNKAKNMLLPQEYVELTSWIKQQLSKDVPQLEVNI